MTASRFPRRLRHAMPVTDGARLVSAFLARHGAGLHDLAAAPGGAGVADALNQVRHAARTQAHTPEALGDALETLRDRIDDLHAAPALQASPRLGGGADAAVRWYAARLTDLSRFCKQL